MEIIRKTGLTYEGQKVEIIKDAKVDYLHFKFFEKEKVEIPKEGYIKGYSWRVCEYGEYRGAAGKRAWASEQEALADAKSTVARWAVADQHRDEEVAKANALKAKAFGSKEEALRHGCTAPVLYSCQECGKVFWAEWRSNYSAHPDCPVCGVNDMYKIEIERGPR